MHFVSFPHHIAFPSHHYQAHFILKNLFALFFILFSVPQNLIRTVCVILSLELPSEPGGLTNGSQRDSVLPLPSICELLTEPRGFCFVSVFETGSRCVALTGLQYSM